VKVIIFDFDGTIADSFDTVLGIVNRLALEFGFEPFNLDEVKQLRNLNSREIVRQSQSRISVFRLVLLLRRLKAEVNREIRRLQPIDGMTETLWALKQRGDRLGIVTSNSYENVSAFLETHGLKDWFEFIYTGTTIFGKGKVLRRVLRDNTLNAAALIYVGDETRDIEAAKKTGIRVVAVSWGFNSKEILAEQHPDFLIQYPHQLVEVINHLDPKSQDSIR
jgi:HAD superfamily hydrolase (TIGR01549 family)